MFPFHLKAALTKTPQAIRTNWCHLRREAQHLRNSSHSRNSFRNLRRIMQKNYMQDTGSDDSASEGSDITR
ncbi:hypothetical protein AOLI_G00212880 [Acnodon oligacanthus]